LLTSSQLEINDVSHSLRLAALEQRIERHYGEIMSQLSPEEANQLDLTLEKMSIDDIRLMIGGDED
jgi:hypothetical protein